MKPRLTAGRLWIAQLRLTVLENPTMTPKSTAQRALDIERKTRAYLERTDATAMDVHAEIGYSLSGIRTAMEKIATRTGARIDGRVVYTLRKQETVDDLLRKWGRAVA